MDQESQTEDEQSLDPAKWVDAHGDALFRFALLRTGDRFLAEDLVQETFLAAVKAIDSFRSESRVSTWLISILRRKIVDQFRSRKKDVAVFDSRIVENPSGGSLDGLPLKAWNDDPARLFEDKQFWEIFHQCAAKLPEKLADAYFLKELDRMSTPEICDVLQISPTNLSMRLYRARLLMRHCLDKSWFQADEE